MIRNYDYTLCDKDCKDVQDGICQMLGIKYLIECTEDMIICKALENE